MRKQGEYGRQRTKCQLNCATLRGDGEDITCIQENVLIVQIYEIQTPSEAETIIALDVDHIGSVILSESQWKNPKVYDVVRLTQSAGRRSSLIPLFRTFEKPEILLKTLDHYRPDIVHFCDSLSDGNGIREVCRKMVSLQKVVKQEFPAISIMRSIPIAPTGFTSGVPTIELAALFEAVSDYFLTDTVIVNNTKDLALTKVEQAVVGFIGITGRTCDWDAARHLVETTRIPVILAGGISPNNVEAGLSNVRPAGVDSCTGTNATDAAGQAIRFKKDPEKVKRLVEAVRRYDNHR